MRTFFVLICFCYLISCKQKVIDSTIKKKDAFQIMLPDTSKHTDASRVDYSHYLNKTALSKRLSLNPLTNGTDIFEMRIWAEHGLPYILYILKGIDTSWLLSRYSYYIKMDSYPY